MGALTQVQFDNARESRTRRARGASVVGWGKSARYLTRVIRLCLYLAVTPIFIPQRRPQRNGAVGNFNSWFQPLLFSRRFKHPGYLRRELVRLMETANQHHVQPRLGQQTIAQYRRGKRLRKLPAKLKLDLDHLPITEGRVVFMRSVSARGRISLLGQAFQVGRRHKFTYVKAVLDTKRQRLTVYLASKIYKRWPYKLSRH